MSANKTHTPPLKKRGSRVYKRVDISGQKFGRLTVLGYSHDDPNSDCISMWACLCDCGKQTVVRVGALRSGRIRSCGCIHLEGKPNRKHPLYHIWQTAKNRCINPRSNQYKRYGGRGIKMCNKWLNSYDCFFDYCISLYIPGRNIDRINNDGNYEPGNIRWVTDSTSVRNRSVTKLTEEKVVEIRNSKLTHKELAQMYGVSKQTISCVRSKKSKQWAELW